MVFKDAATAISTVTDGTTSVINWTGTLALDNPATMYKLSATEPYVETLIGAPTDPAAVDITLRAGGWTWIGYPAQATNALDAAFASANPQEGDLVKSQNAFSIYTEGAWMGTLTAMTPGEGYLYNSVAATGKTFTFPKPAVSGKKNAPRLTSHLPPLTSQFRDNMTMIAVVMDGDEPVTENVEVSVYAGTELRGLSTAALSLLRGESEGACTS